MSDFPFCGDELLRVPLGDTGFDLVFRDDGDPDYYTLAKIEDPDGDSLSMTRGMNAIREITDDDHAFVEMLENSLACSCTSDPDPAPSGPPPISTLPVTFSCDDCETRYARTRLATPCESENLCDGCAGKPSPYRR